MKLPLLTSIAAITACGALHAPAQKPDATLATACAEIAAAAKAVIATLDDDARARTMFPFDSEERTNWHFVPRVRQGLPLADMTEPQRDKTRDLLTAALSTKGLLKVDTLIALESVLARIENNPTRRDPLKYHLSLFGDPTPQGTWGWRFEGHHLSINLTFTGGTAVSSSPVFMGANPAEQRDGPGKGTRPLAAEEDLARTLARALADAGKPVVYTDRPPDDILTANDRKARQLDPVGVPTSEMTPAQRDGLLALISEYANRFRPEIAAADMAKIRADLENLRFAWAGGLDPGQAYYYRVQGTTFLIEACNVQNQANHIHTVWRDREGDFGRDILGDHQRHHLQHGHNH
jgi:hypothetical protein